MLVSNKKKFENVISTLDMMLCRCVLVIYVVIGCCSHIYVFVFAAPGISANPDPNNCRYFHIMLTGPAGTCYEGGLYRLELFLPEQYPMEPPKVRFLTKIYHPNIVSYLKSLMGEIENKFVMLWAAYKHPSCMRYASLVSSFFFNFMKPRQTT